MNDPVVHDAGGGPTTSDDSRNDDLMAKVEQILDWAATKSIQEDPTCHVVQDYDQAFETLGVSRSEMVGHYTEDPRGILTIDHGAGKTSHWYLWGSEAWTTQRDQFSDTKPLFEKFLDFTPGDFVGPHALIATAQRRLLPVEDFESVAADLINNQKPATPEVTPDFYQSMTLIDKWDGIGKIEEKLSDEWTGVAAQVFKAIYVRQLPAILTGQSATAMLLSESLDVSRASYFGARQTAERIANEGLFVVQNYPHHGTADGGVSWVTFLNMISGGATIVAALAAPVAGIGTGVSVVAGVVAGTATIASTAISDNAQIDVDAIAKKMEIDGATVSDVVANINNALQTALQTVYDVEQHIANELTKFVQFIESGIDSNVIIDPTWKKEDIQLNVWEAYFAPPPPKIASISSDTSFETISSTDYMDVAPDEGASFASDLQNLYDVAGRYLPDLASNFSGIATQADNAPDSLDAAFTRAGGRSPVYAAWTEMHGLFMTMLTATGENLNAAGIALEIVADAFAAADDEASDHINASTES